MGQYWMPVNLTKKEYINPHKLACGLKLWEQIAAHPSTGTALLVLCTAMPDQRGGGDFSTDTENEEYNKIAKRTIGRWAGDRIALVGDYAEREDLPDKDKADTIYNRCYNPKEFDKEDLADTTVYPCNPFKDISDDVCQVIEYELEGKFVGEEGWRDFKRNRRSK